MAFSQLPQLQLDQKTKDDIDCLIRFARITRFYAKLIGENTILQGQAKADIAFLFNSINSFINRFRAGIRPEQKEAFERELNKDFYSWAEIIQALTYMDDKEAEAVERFCVGIATGQIIAEVQDGTNLIINNEAL
jgi:hypothetical protein